MNQIAFVILFLYIRSFPLSKYSKDFENGKIEPQPDNEECKIDISRQKQQKKVLEKYQQVEANYSLARRTFW